MILGQYCVCVCVLSVPKRAFGLRLRLSLVRLRLSLLRLRLVRLRLVRLRLVERQADCFGCVWYAFGLRLVVRLAVRLVCVWIYHLRLRLKPAFGLRLCV